MNKHTNTTTNALQRQLDKLAYQRWLQHTIRTLIQAGALGISLWVIALGVQFITPWHISDTTMILVILGGFLLGLLFLLRPRMSMRHVAQRLDHRFGLQEQITTALEVSHYEHADGVAAYLLQKARHNIAQVQRYTTAKRSLPWVDVVTLAAVLSLGVGFSLLLYLDTNHQPPRPPLPLPPLAGPGDPPPLEFPMEPFAAPPGQGNGTGTMSGDGGSEQLVPITANGVDKQSLQTIANALRDLSITRAAADALDAGNTQQAASALREVADNADQLSEDTRRDVSQAMYDAATQISTNDPDLSTTLRQVSQQLRQETNDVANAFDTLAATIEQLGNETPQSANQPTPSNASQTNPAPNGPDTNNPSTGVMQAGNNEIAPSDQRERSTMAHEYERLGVEGVPLELDGGDTANTPHDDHMQLPDDSVQSSNGSFRQAGANSDGTNANRVDVGNDPLRIPTELRDVVQEYFSPTP